MPSGSDILVIWIELLVLAGQINDCGSIYFNHEVPYTADLLASQFGFPISTIQLALTTFLKFEMIDIIDDIIMISNWQKYQNEEALARIRALANARQQRHRQKVKEQKLLESGESNVTGNVVGNVTCHEKCSYISISNISSSLSKEVDEDSKKKRSSKKVSNEKFERFYQAYPKKVSKDYALKCFEKINPDDELLETMLKAIERQKMTRQWQDKQYIPNPSTWLNQGKWKDEIPDDALVGHAPQMSQKASSSRNPKSHYNPDGTYDYQSGLDDEWESL